MPRLCGAFFILVAMRITRDLKFKSEIDTEQRGIVHFYSGQISRDVFEENFAELGDVVTYVTGVGGPLDLIRVAPQLAYPALKKAALNRGTWQVKNASGQIIGGVEQSLILEIERLTNVAISTDMGMQVLPLPTAVSQGHLDEDDRADILSQIIFFTSVSRAGARDFSAVTLEACVKFHGWLLTSLTFTEVLNSLKGSTTPENMTKRA